MTTRQTRIPSGFGAETTAREVIGDRRLDGLIAIVTGGYAGVGLETTRALSGAGATVIVPARTPDKARKALAGMDRVEIESLDLIDPKSIDAFAARFLATACPAHILINNAGIMATPFVRDARREFREGHPPARLVVRGRDAAREPVVHTGDIGAAVRIFQ